VEEWYPPYPTVLKYHNTVATRFFTVMINTHKPKCTYGGAPDVVIIVIFVLIIIILLVSDDKATVQWDVTGLQDASTLANDN